MARAGDGGDGPCLLAHLQNSYAKNSIAETQRRPNASPSRLVGFMRALDFEARSAQLAIGHLGPAWDTRRSAH